MLDTEHFKTKAPYPLVFFFLPLFFSSSPVSLCSSHPDGSLVLCKHVRKVEASFSVCSRRVQYIIMESHLEKRRPWSNCNKACWPKITLSINLTVKILSIPSPTGLFISSSFEWGRRGYRGEGDCLKGEGLFNLLKIMVSILNKERKVETRGHIKLGVMEPKIKKQIRTFCT